MRARFVAPAAGRLDKLLAAHTKLSRKRARLLIERGGVRVDGSLQRRASADVPQGALVEIRGTGAPGKSTGATLVERFRDRWLLVVDKPSGLPSQPTRSGHAQHLYGILQATEAYVGLHHRLDTPASGLVLLTVDRSANKAIAEGFRTGQIHRHYQVVVVGDPGDAGEWTTELDGQAARTRFRRISSAGGMSVLECRLDTGRTHQIRRHAATAGTPVVGDRRHGGAAGRLWPRLALHAAALELAHPITGETLRVDSPLPPDLTGLFAPADPPETTESAT